MSVYDFVIWGAGGHGKVVADILRDQSGEEVSVAYVDRARVGEIAEPGGSRVQWHQDEFFEACEAGRVTSALILAVGNNELRTQVFRRLSGCVGMPTVVHSSACVSPHASLDDATHVCPRVVIHPAAQIGAAVILNTGCIVEHDCVINDGAHISPGAVLAGGVSIGERSWVGAGAVVINNVTVGKNSIIGAGAVVIRDVPDGVTVVGNPARVIDAGE